jgi:prevent-host-death family protein
MTTISVTDAKVRLNALVEEAASTHERVTLTLRGRPAAVMMSVEDLEGLEETILRLSDQAARDAIRERPSGSRGGDQPGRS